MRFHEYGANETAPQRLGDTRWRGVNMRLDPHVLEPGLASEAINCRFIRGVPETRLGTMVLPWANKISGNDIQPWGTIYGIGVFNDPISFQDFLVIAADGNLYVCQPHNMPQTMTLPSGITITEDVTFTQAFNQLIMHRGFDDRPLQLTGVSSAWAFISQSQDAIDAGTAEIPPTKRGLFFQNRLFLPKQSDEIAISDFNDPTSYQPVLQVLKINQGSSDRIVNMVKFNDVTLIVFKDRSVYALTSVSGNLSTTILDVLTDQFGLVAAKSVAHCGSDLLFLSEHGVMSIRQTEQNKLQSVVLPLSDPMQPVIDRINWQYASDAVAAYWDNRYYLAVPLDEAEQLGPELTSAQMAYTDPGLTITVPVTANAVYRWEKTAEDTSLANGSQTLTNSADFTAEGATVILTGPAEAVLQCSLKRVYKGVNNAILVYDFLNQAWAGYDQSDGLIVKEMFLFPYNGQRRLFITTHEGYVKLYEEDYEDQLSQPTSTLTVSSSTKPSVGDTIRVNNGNTITAINAANNSGTDWGCQSATTARNNIFNSNNSTIRSYAPLTASPWTSPNAYAVSNTTGVVKWYGQNGVIPQIRTKIATISSITRSGTTATVTTAAAHGYGADDIVTITGSNQTPYNGNQIIVTAPTTTTFTFKVNGSPATPATGTMTCGVWLTNTTAPWGSVVESGHQQITTTLVTRAYTDPQGDLSDYQWLHVDLQTWNPSYSIDVITPGSEETFAQASAQTKDRRKWYRPFDKADFTADNTGGQFMDKWRKDYSAMFGAGTGETASLRVDTTSGGIRLDLHQDSRETFHINRDARSLQVKIVNAQGRVRVMGCLLEAAKRVSSGFVEA